MAIPDVDDVRAAHGRRTPVLGPGNWLADSRIVEHEGEPVVHAAGRRGGLVDPVPIAAFVGVVECVTQFVAHGDQAVGSRHILCKNDEPAAKEVLASYGCASRADAPGYQRLISGTQHLNSNGCARGKSIVRKIRVQEGDVRVIHLVKVMGNDGQIASRLCGYPELDMDVVVVG